MNANAPGELLAALTEAVSVALREMAGVELLVPKVITPGRTEVPEADLSAVLPVTTAAGTGCLVLALPESTAAALARRVLARAGVASEPDAAAVRDCCGEIVNVIAGQAKTLLRGTPYHFTLSTPHVEAGGLLPDGAFVIAFDGEVGDFALRVRLPV